MRKRDGYPVGVDLESYGYVKVLGHIIESLDDDVMRLPEAAL